MDPKSTIPSFEIPKSPETDPARKLSGDYDPSLKIEDPKETLPAPAGSMVSVSAVPASDSPQTAQAAVSPAPPAPALPISDDHLIADDADVIEKEWVEKAKKVISLTSDDPHQETIEINKLKATYMKKRFNKDIPIIGQEE